MCSAWGVSYGQCSSVAAQAAVVLVVDLFGEQQVIRLQLDRSLLQQFVPLVVLLILNFEPGLDGLAAVVLGGDQLGVVEVGVL